MQQALFLFLAAAALSGCDDLHPCYEAKVVGGVETTVYVGDRRCFRLSSPRKMTGLWVRRFEYSAFYEGATDPASIDDGPGAWFNTYELLGGGEIDVKSGNIYRVELIGRTPLPSPSSLLFDYSETNGYDGIVVVDESTRSS